MTKRPSDPINNSTGIRSKTGPIPDDHFENDAAAAVGDPVLSQEAQATFDEKIASQKARLAKRLNRPDLA